MKDSRLQLLLGSRKREFQANQSLMHIAILSNPNQTKTPLGLGHSV